MGTCSDHRASAKSVGKLRPWLADRSRLDADVADRVQRDLGQRKHDLGGGPQRFDQAANINRAVAADGPLEQNDSGHARNRTWPASAFGLAVGVPSRDSQIRAGNGRIGRAGPLLDRMRLASRTSWYQPGGCSGWARPVRRGVGGGGA